MKITNKLMSLSLAAAALLASSSCKNSDIEFDDFGTTTVYFGNQYPVRTIVFGEDNDVDLTLDNKGMFQIGATFGGSYKGKDIVANISVDESLLENLYWDAEGNVPVKALPKEYYTLASNEIKFGGDFTGYVDVQLTEAFFNDPQAFAVMKDRSMSFSNGAYVIPVVITSQTGADRILTGEYDQSSFSQAPARCDASSWNVVPKDYQLLAVNYINEFSGYWLQSGTDNVNGVDVSREVKNEYVIEDKVVHLATAGRRSVIMDSPKYKFADDKEAVSYPIQIDIDADGVCKVSKPAANAADAYEVIDQGGVYKLHGAGQYWGAHDRDLIELSYTIKADGNTFVTSDKLVSQRRGVKYNQFTPNYIK